MGTFVNPRFHTRRAQEERARAERAMNPAARAAHARLAKFHARLAASPTFVPADKASRWGRAASYWAALHLSGKASEESEAPAAEGGEAPALPREFGMRPGAATAIATLLRKTFPPAPREDPWTPAAARRRTPR